MTLRLAARLGDRDGVGALETEDHLLTKDSRGNFYVWSDSRPYVWIFDSKGKFQSRFGNEGKGPGEFQRMAGVTLGKNDTVFAFDLAARRMSVFSPSPAHPLVRAAPLVFAPGFDLALAGNSIVMNAHIRTQELAGLPLHLLRADGAIARSFGSETGAYRPDVAYQDRRRVAAAGSDAVWSAYLNQYVIQRWDTSGRLTRTIAREIEWFPTYSRTEAIGKAAPEPATEAIMQSGDTLWVLVQVAGANWRSAIAPFTAGNGRQTYRVTNRNEYRNTMIEAIDLRKGVIVASVRVPQRLMGFAGPGFVYQTALDEDGNAVVEIYALVLGAR